NRAALELVLDVKVAHLLFAGQGKDADSAKVLAKSGRSSDGNDLSCPPGRELAVQLRTLIWLPAQYIQRRSLHAGQARRLEQQPPRFCRTDDYPGRARQHDAPERQGRPIAPRQR